MNSNNEFSYLVGCNKDQLELVVKTILEAQRSMLKLRAGPIASRLFLQEWQTINRMIICQSGSYICTTDATIAKMDIGKIFNGDYIKLCTTWRRTVLMNVLTAGVNPESQSFWRSPAPLKHHRRIPPLLKIAKKSNIFKSFPTPFKKMWRLLLSKRDAIFRVLISFHCVLRVQRSRNRNLVEIKWDVSRHSVG